MSSTRREYLASHKKPGKHVQRSIAPQQATSAPILITPQRTPYNTTKAKFLGWFKQLPPMGKAVFILACAAGVASGVYACIKLMQWAQELPEYQQQNLEHDVALFQASYKIAFSPKLFSSPSPATETQSPQLASFRPLTQSQIKSLLDSKIVQTNEKNKKIIYKAFTGAYQLPQAEQYIEFVLRYFDFSIVVKPEKEIQKMTGGLDGVYMGEFAPPHPGLQEKTLYLGIRNGAIDVNLVAHEMRHVMWDAVHSILSQGEGDEMLVPYYPNSDSERLSYFQNFQIGHERFQAFEKYLSNPPKKNSKEDATFKQYTAAAKTITRPIFVPMAQATANTLRVNTSYRLQIGGVVGRFKVIGKDTDSDGKPAIKLMHENPNQALLLAFEDLMNTLRIYDHSVYQREADAYMYQYFTPQIIETFWPELSHAHEEILSQAIQAYAEQEQADKLFTFDGPRL